MRGTGTERQFIINASRVICIPVYLAVETLMMQTEPLTAYSKYKLIISVIKFYIDILVILSCNILHVHKCIVTSTYFKFIALE